MLYLCGLYSHTSQRKYSLWSVRIYSAYLACNVFGRDMSVRTGHAIVYLFDLLGLQREFFAIFKILSVLVPNKDLENIGRIEKGCYNASFLAFFDAWSCAGGKIKSYAMMHTLIVSKSHPICPCNVFECFKVVGHRSYFQKSFKLSCSFFCVLLFLLN